MRPGIWLWNGMQFPVEGLGGKCDPEFTLEVGCAFPTGPQAETASHSRQEFRYTVSGCKKRPHDVAFNLYMLRIPPPMTSRAPTTGRLSGRQNIRFIASSAQAGEHLMCSPCEQDCRAANFAPPASPPASGPRLRYLILVVPGARLGSVSLASVWKCSVYTFLPSRNIS